MGCRQLPTGTVVPSSCGSGAFWEASTVTGRQFGERWCICLSSFLMTTVIRQRFQGVLKKRQPPVNLCHELKKRASGQMARINWSCQYFITEPHPLSLSLSLSLSLLITANVLGKQTCSVNPQTPPPDLPPLPSCPHSKSTLTAEAEADGEVKSLEVSMRCSSGRLHTTKTPQPPMLFPFAVAPRGGNSPSPSLGQRAEVARHTDTAIYPLAYLTYLAACAGPNTMDARRANTR